MSRPAVPPGLSARILLLAKGLDEAPCGGRQLLSKLNYDALRELFGEQLLLFELPRSKRRGLASAIGAFRGHIDGLDAAVIDKAMETIQAEKIDKVFVDGSNLGEFAKVVKQRLPQVQVTTFFHNVEARFFLGSLRQSTKLRALAVLVANYLAERKSVRHSDKIICLNGRDSRLLRRIYGRGATHVAPMSMQDALPEGAKPSRGELSERYALFVGGVFYANRVGITWFVNNVVPRIGIKLCIVGKGFEGFRRELEREGMVEVVGAVESLVPWYMGAEFVVAPIFDGSGMKTKIAEALMFGKSVIGTPEAFSGYEDIAGRAGWVCSTADEFVVAIERITRRPPTSFDPDLRGLYEERFSYPAARARLARILLD